MTDTPIHYIIGVRGDILPETIASTEVGALTRGMELGHARKDMDLLPVRVMLVSAFDEMVRQAEVNRVIALAAIAYVDRNEKPFTKENVTLWQNLRDIVNIWKASQIEAAELADGVVKEIEVHPKNQKETR